MTNPFETIDSRLTTIESLLLDIKQRVKMLLFPRLKPMRY